MRYTYQDKMRMNGAKRPARIQLRKQPRQERSIQRLDTILSAAVTLIADRGIRDMKMTDLAAEAGVPIGSLYQFFPEKAAVIRALHDRHTAQVEAGTRSFFADVTTIAEAEDTLARAIDVFYDFYRNDPTYLPIWLSALSDPDLQSLNQRHIDRITGIFHDIFAPLLPEGSGIDIEARVRVYIYVSGSILRFAFTQNEEMARRLIGEWKANIAKTMFTP